VLDCVTQCSQSAADYMSSSYRSNRLGLSHWDLYTVHRGGCLELYYRNMVEWFWWDSTWSWQPTGFLQCFVKIVLKVTYSVSSGTLNPTHSLRLRVSKTWLQPASRVVVNHPYCNYHCTATTQLLQLTMLVLGMHLSFNFVNV